MKDLGWALFGFLLLAVLLGVLATMGLAAAKFVGWAWS